MRFAGTENLNKYSGMSLLEILLAMMLSLLLIAMLTKIYLVLRHTIDEQRSLQHQQHAAEKMVAILTDEVHMAGHLGCHKLTNQFHVDTTVAHTLTAENFLTVEAKTMTVKYQSFPGAVLVENMKHPSRMVVDTGVRFRVGQILVISDCAHAEIFQVGDVRKILDKQIIDAKHGLHHLYRQYTEIGSLTSRHYFLGKSYYQQKNRPVNYALMRRNIDGSQQEMVDEIDRLSFQRDESGVYFDFETKHSSSRQAWHGYAGSYVSKDH